MKSLMKSTVHHQKANYTYYGDESDDDVVRGLNLYEYEILHKLYKLKMIGTIKGQRIMVNSMDILHIKTFKKKVYGLDQQSNVPQIPYI